MELADAAAVVSAARSTNGIGVKLTLSLEPSNVIEAVPLPVVTYCTVTDRYCRASNDAGVPVSVLMFWFPDAEREDRRRGKSLICSLASATGTPRGWRLPRYLDTHRGGGQRDIGLARRIEAIDQRALVDDVVRRGAAERSQHRRQRIAGQRVRLGDRSHETDGQRLRRGDADQRACRIESRVTGGRRDP